MTWWKRVAREPLVHFLVIGVALFAFDALRGPRRRVEAPVAAPVAPVATRAPATGPIIVDADVVARVRVQAERKLGRAPAAPEVEAELARWIDEEVLFREATARGLDRDDPVVHKRIADRMMFVLEQSTAVAEPTEADLQGWFEAHREQWARPAHIDFTHVFVAGTDAAAVARVTELERTLASGGAPDRLGDVFPGGRRYRGRKLADLALAFGDEFVDGLATQPLGTWQRRTSRHGIHLVRVDRVEAERAADLAAARLDVRKAWQDDRRARELATAMGRLRARWEIVKQ